MSENSEERLRYIRRQAWKNVHRLRYIWRPSAWKNTLSMVMFLLAVVGAAMIFAAIVETLK